MIRVLDINSDSPFYGKVHPGFTLVSINGKRVRDALDFRYKIVDEVIDIRFADRNGRKIAFHLDEQTTTSLGLTLDDDRIRRCGNDCIFCFVSQQPPGMRPALYVKDEDYRLSFTHGNFITLSNTTEADLRRIIHQRLSPLYVSVHTTDDKLRRYLMQNEKVPPIMPRLRRLIENGITIHAQIVLCPGMNDDAHLAKTIDDLAALAPGVASLAVVPVGLTRFREELPVLRPCTATEAGEIVDEIEVRQRRFLKSIGSRFVWVADEFYVIAGRKFPSRASYEEMPQFENGVGMVREFITMFNRRRSRFGTMRSKKRMLLLTGESAYPFISEEIMPHINSNVRLEVDLQQVPNRFWGRTVTVSGLLTGQDLLREARARAAGYDVLIIPPNCLNSDNLFLDNLSLARFKYLLDKEVVVGSYNLAESIREVIS